MKTLKKYLNVILFIGVLVFVLLLLFVVIKQNPYLLFSDAAKYADIARNISAGLGYVSNFYFFGGPPVALPVSSFIFAIFFKIFGVSDLTVILTSSLFFLLTVFFVFLLAKKITNSNLVGILSSLTFGANYDLITYATNGSTESIFIFEIIASAYFLSFKNKWVNFVGLILLFALYFTRPQGFIYIVGLIIYWLFLNFPVKKAIVYLVFTLILGIIVDICLLNPLSGKYFLYSIITRGEDAAVTYLPGGNASDALREVSANAAISIAPLFKKVFYNLYNFYKLLPQILSPYLVAIFVLGIFKWSKSKTYNSFKVSSIFMIFTTFLITALSIPMFRYIHPVIPFVIIFSIDTIVWAMRKIFSSDKAVAFSSLILILFIAVGQTLGIIFLDSRFKSGVYNTNKPPVYFQFSKILKENTDADQKIITNLDTWGSWYGERKTTWFPLKPSQLISAEGEIGYDAIYLTSYMMDDQSYYMGKEWREIFDNSERPSEWNCDGCKEIARSFKVKNIYQVYPEEIYENMNYRSILLIKK